MVLVERADAWVRETRLDRVALVCGMLPKERWV